MTAATWKALEDRVGKALGGRRVLGNRGTGVPDCDERVPFAVEVKRTKRLSLQAKWVVQARRNAAADGRPWLLVQATHGSQRPVATLDFLELVRICELAGLVPADGTKEPL